MQRATGGADEPRYVPSATLIAHLPLASA